MTAGMGHLNPSHLKITTVLMGHKKVNTKTLLKYHCFLFQKSQTKQNKKIRIYKKEYLMKIMDKLSYFYIKAYVVGSHDIRFGNTLSTSHKW